MAYQAPFGQKKTHSPIQNTMHNIFFLKASKLRQTSSLAKHGITKLQLIDFHRIANQFELDCKRAHFEMRNKPFRNAT